MYGESEYRLVDTPEGSTLFTPGAFTFTVNLQGIREEVFTLTINLQSIRKGVCTFTINLQVIRKGVCTALPLDPIKSRTLRKRCSTKK